MELNGGDDLEGLLRALPAVLPSDLLKTLPRIKDCTAQAIPFSRGIENGVG